MVDTLSPPRAAQANVVTDVARSLAEVGYALVNLSADPAVLRLCDEAVDQTRVWHDRGFNRVQDAWRRAPAVRALATLPRVMSELENAFRAKPFAFQTLNFFTGSQQRAHSDMIHFTPEPAHQMCGVWLALEDVKEEAGPLFYYPGSHRLPVLTLEEAGAPGDAAPQQAYRRFYEPAMARRMERAGLLPQTALLKKGEIFIWAANLVHGGAPVMKKGATRHSQVTHVFFKGGDYHTLLNARSGARAYRLPTDIATGRFIWPRRGRPSPKTIAAALDARIRRKVHTFGALAPQPR